MDRLTMRSSIDDGILIKVDKGEYQSICFGCSRIARCKNKCPEHKAYSKLADYEDMEEQGKLAKLPCAVGSTVYRINHLYTKCSAHDQAFDEFSCQGCESACDSRKEYYIQPIKAASISWIAQNLEHFYDGGKVRLGKTLFVSEEKAKELLALM